MELRAVEGFDGGWIVFDGADGRVHFVGGAHEPGLAAAEAAIPRVQRDLVELGPDAWCWLYQVDRRALGESP